MSFVVNEEINLIFDSNPNNGATNINPLGSLFEINLDDIGIGVPKDAISVNVSLEESNIWFNTPNVISSENDIIRLSVPNTSDVLTSYTLVVPEGLYDVSQLNETIQRELQQQGAKIDPSPVISLTADDATQKIIITWNYDTPAGQIIDFTVANNMAVLLGFEEQIYNASTQNPLEAPNVAEFNSVNYYVVRSDIVAQGLRFNNRYNNVIGIVNIDVQPNFQITSKPFNPAKSNGNDLAGNKKRKIKFWLTDDRNRLVNTRGEYWSGRVRINYQRPYVVEKM